MRRLLFVPALVAVCAVWAAPTAAQVTDNRWFLNAGIGPSVGTVGTTPVAAVSTGIRMTPRWSIVGEAGLLPRASVDKAVGIAPTMPRLVPSQEDRYVNHAHANANVLFELGGWTRFNPYVTGGVGAFAGQSVARGAVDGARVAVNQHAVHPATNVGAGARYWLTDWFGVTADYRHFQVYADRTRSVNRFATGVTVALK